MKDRKKRMAEVREKIASGKIGVRVRQTKPYTIVALDDGWSVLGIGIARYNLCDERDGLPWNPERGAEIALGRAVRAAAEKGAERMRCYSMRIPGYGERSFRWYAL